MIPLSLPLLRNYYETTYKHIISYYFGITIIVTCTVTDNNKSTRLSLGLTAVHSASLGWTFDTAIVSSCSYGSVVEAFREKNGECHIQNEGSHSPHSSRSSEKHRETKKRHRLKFCVLLHGWIN